MNERMQKIGNWCKEHKKQIIVTGVVIGCGVAGICIRRKVRMDPMAIVKDVDGADLILDFLDTCDKCMEGTTKHYASLYGENFAKATEGLDTVVQVCGEKLKVTSLILFGNKVD